MESDSNANNQDIESPVIKDQERFVIGDADIEEGYNSDVDDFDNNVIVPAVNNIEVVANPQNQSFDEKHCWVCFASEEDDPSASWTSPCR